MTVTIYDCPKCGESLTNGQISGRVKRLKCCTSEDRFWGKVNKSVAGCWPYMGAGHRDGYGRAHAVRDGKNRIYIAHRLAYEFTRGPIPAGMDVLHDCDNPICCNPAHLRLGTHRENMIEMRQKGRCSRQAFTPDQVRVIREELVNAKRGDQQRLARQYGVSPSVINDVKLGHTYRWIDGESGDQ